MKETNKKADQIDENQSLMIIKEMIQVSQKKIKNDGILFIVWGYVMLYNYLSSYILRNLVISFQVEDAFRYFGNGLGIAAFAYTIYYIYKKSRKTSTYISISLRYVWISLIICLSMTNIIMYKELGTLNIELQHPILMLFIAFATVVTGGILRYKLIIIGGIVFGMLAYTCSFLDIGAQMIAEAAAWLIAFIIPGHYLFANRKK